MKQEEAVGKLVEAYDGKATKQEVEELFAKNKSILGDTLKGISADKLVDRVLFATQAQLNARLAIKGSAASRYKGRLKVLLLGTGNSRANNKKQIDAYKANPTIFAEKYPDAIVKDGKLMGQNKTTQELFELKINYDIRAVGINVDDEFKPISLMFLNFRRASQDEATRLRTRLVPLSYYEMSYDDKRAPKELGEGITEIGASDITARIKSVDIKDLKQVKEVYKILNKFAGEFLSDVSEIDNIAETISTSKGSFSPKEGFYLVSGTLGELGETTTGLSTIRVIETGALGAEVKAIQGIYPKEYKLLDGYAPGTEVMVLARFWLAAATSGATKAVDRLNTEILGALPSYKEDKVILKPATLEQEGINIDQKSDKIATAKAKGLMDEDEEEEVSQEEMA
jgi:hypothetical protein